MNYFGHAAVASWHAGPVGGDDGELGRLALGAMLPDLCGMCGARLAACDDPVIARGIELHHATDRIFHQSSAVLAAFRDAEARLAARGCRKGPTRGAAHVAVELILDGLLVDEPSHRAAYLAALAVAPSDPGPLRWRDPDGDPPRFAFLLARLRSHGVPDDLRDPARVTARILRVLRGRPLLEPDAGEAAAIALVIDDLTRTLAPSRDRLIAPLRTAMPDAGASS